MYTQPVRIHGMGKHDTTVPLFAVATLANMADGTVYQNTSGRAMIVGGQMLTGTTWTLTRDASNPPTTTIYTGGNGVNISFVVPPNHYYKCAGGTSQYTYQVI